MKTNIRKIIDRDLIDIFVLGTIYEEDDFKEFIPEFDNIYLQYDEYIICISKKADFTLDI